MKKLEKKQIPQFAALCILSAGTFGYFVVRMVTPSPAAASTAAHPAVPATASAQAGTTLRPAAGTTAAPGAAAVAPSETAALAPDAAGNEPLLPQPAPGMRDPFVVGYVAPKDAPPAAVPPPALPAPASSGKQSAGASLPGLMPLPAPPAPALPGTLSALSMRAATSPASAPTPSAPPPAPAWTVTGVLQNDTESLAILRNGEARRLVRSGDFVDSTYRVIAVSRAGVKLRHDTSIYMLKLGQTAELTSSPKTLSVSLRASSPQGQIPAGMPSSAPGLLTPGMPAPDFELTSSSGIPVSLSSLRGHVVLLDFWATWCGPCQRSMPHVQHLHEEFGTGLKVLSINTWDEWDTMKLFVQANPQYTTTMLFDSRSTDVSTGKYLVKGIPTVYLIDKSGRVAGAFVAPTEETLTQAILALGVHPSSSPALSRAGQILGRLAKAFLSKAPTALLDNAWAARSGNVPAAAAPDAAVHARSSQPPVQAALRFLDDKGWPDSRTEARGAFRVAKRSDNE